MSRLVVVTGAASGIGRATATAFAEDGASVVVVDVNREQAEKTAASLPDAEARECDVRDPAAVEALAASLARVPDVVVNNAGVGMTGRFADMTIEDWEWIRSVNLDGVLNGCRTFGRAMLRRGSGHIVNVSSGLAYMPHATEPAYVTTKAAVLAFSQCLRADWRPQGVSVTVVCPGVINTPIIDATRFVGDQAATREKTAKAFRRGHKPEKVAADIVKGVREDKAIVFSGFEARVGWWLHRLSPVAIGQLGARVSV